MRPPTYEEALQLPRPEILEVGEYEEPPLWWEVDESLQKAIEEQSWGDMAQLLNYTYADGDAGSGEGWASDFVAPHWLGRSGTAKEEYESHARPRREAEDAALTWLEHVLAEP